MALFLIDKGADIEKNGGALMRGGAAQPYGRGRAADRQGADIDTKEGEYTPLGNAVRIGQFDVTELLVRKGADLNVRDSLGNTILDNAVIYGSEDNLAIELLLDRLVEVNTTRPPCVPRFRPRPGGDTRDSSITIGPVAEMRFSPTNPTAGPSCGARSSAAPSRS